MSAELIEAVERHELARLAKLLADGVDPNAANLHQPGWGALKLAVDELTQGGSLGAVVLLLRHGADADSSHDTSGHTPLVVAAQYRQLEAARLLLAAGANPNARDDEGDCPLRLSAELGERSMAELLLSCGADQTINEAGGMSGRNALGWAAYKLDYPMVNLLMCAGADPHVTDVDRMSAANRLPARTESNAEAWDAVAARLGLIGQRY